MSKMIAVVVAVLLPLFAFGEDANRMKYVLLLPPVNLIEEMTSTGTAINVAAYKGNASFGVLAQNSTGSGRTNTITIQHSTTGTNLWNTVTNLAGSALVFSVTGTNTVLGVSSNLPCDLARFRVYVRALAAQAGTADTNAVAVYMVAPMKSE